MKAFVLAAALVATAARADTLGPTFGAPYRFTEQGGPALYANICAECHMREGQGASGAGRYPALAHNSNLAASGFAIDRVLHGHGAMPPFARQLTDAQIADVVTFIRTHFGNEYPDSPAASDVTAAR
jgi:mono/diheme cytochrome c family protein